MGSLIAMLIMCDRRIDGKGKIMFLFNVKEIIEER